MNAFAQQSLVDHVQSQPDYTSFARAVENIPNFSQPNIHGSEDFGSGGVLGTLGNQAQSPGDLPSRFHQVGGPVQPFDYSGVNVALDFKVDIGNLAPNLTLQQLLKPQGDVLCYDYYSGK
ncbi:hypothetical protein MW887_001128 [Aspergillus wentii]|nr:hypothetical protein MW887_001128 [Aspergillus wentii]